MGAASSPASSSSGGTPALLFHSDWATATGNSDAAITDGGTWNSFYCRTRDQTLEVVEGAPLGFTRTANVLRLQALGPNVCGMLEAVEVLPPSTSHHGRMYFRNDETQTRHNHVMTYFPVGRIQVAAWNRRGTADGFQVFMRTYYDANGADAVYPRASWSIPGLLQNGTWYRYEWHMEYVTPTTYRIWPRIHDMSGALLHDADTFLESDAAPDSGRTLAAHYAAGNAFGFSDVALARNLGLGNEGPANSTSTGGYWYHADVALSLGGWIGE